MSQAEAPQEVRLTGRQEMMGAGTAGPLKIMVPIVKELMRMLEKPIKGAAGPRFRLLKAAAGAVRCKPQVAGQHSILSNHNNC